ncbi:unnamed protein product, partial [Discosporangium mesarthrocarpum]
QDSLKEEERLKKQLRLRLAYAVFVQEALAEMATVKKNK